MNKSQQADPLPPGPSKTNSNKSSKQKERNKRKKEKYKQKKKNKTSIPKLSKAYCNTTKLHTMLLTNKSLRNKLSLHTTSTWQYVAIMIHGFINYY